MRKQEAVYSRKRGPTKGDSLTTPEALANNLAAYLCFPNILRTVVDIRTFRMRVRNLFLPNVFAK